MKVKSAQPNFTGLAQIGLGSLCAKVCIIMEFDILFLSADSFSSALLVVSSKGERERDYFLKSIKRL